MTVQQWLKRGYNLNKEINTLMQEREAAFALATNASAPPSDREYVDGSQLNTTEIYYIQYIEYGRQLDEMLNKLYQVKQEIISFIESIENPTYRTLLFMRYIQCKTWEGIAEELDYSVSWLLRRGCGLRDRALKAAEERYLEQKRNRGN